MAVSIVGDDRVAPYIVEQKNPNFSAKLLLWGDANADGNVDLLDVTVLARYNAEWDGYEAPRKYPSA